MSASTGFAAGALSAAPSPLDARRFTPPLPASALGFRLSLATGMLLVAAAPGFVGRAIDGAGGATVEWAVAAAKRKLFTSADLLAASACLVDDISKMGAQAVLGANSPTSQFAAPA